MAAPSAAAPSQSAPNRFQMTDQEYIDAYGLRAPLVDAISLLQHLSKRVKPTEFLATYFTLLSSPSHLLHRDFKYCNRSASSRLAFIALFRRLFPASSVVAAGGGRALTPEAVHQLCGLIVADFPFSLVRNAARITQDPSTPTSAATNSHSSPASSLPTPTASFLDFSHKLFVLFFYSEFLNQCALTFRSLDSGGSGRVNRRAFQARLQEVAANKQTEFSCPSLRAIDAALAPTHLTTGAIVEEEVMFNNFCVDLFAHADIKQALDVEVEW